MSNICSLDACTGCGACKVSCPKQCISLLPNAQGHLVPQIDLSQCIHCNLCRKVCPVNTPVVLRQPQACYASWAKNDKERTTSSSGGGASVFAAYILKQGGTVYGVALQDNKIQHIRVSSAADLNRLKGSKYVYSEAFGIYQSIKNDLENGKQVLFIGTSCQNAAVLNIVGSKPNLWLVNLICHGVPSMQMLTEHLQAQTHTKDIKTLSFRANNDYVLTCGSYQSSKHIWPDAYLTLFSKGIICRPSCYQCIYAKPERVGDITIGDFWGLGKKKPFEEDTSKGCSVIIVNTQKGADLLKNCQADLQIFKRDYAEAVEGNSQLRAPVLYTHYVKRFNKLYPKFSFKWAGILSSFPLLVRETVKMGILKYAPRSVRSYCVLFSQKMRGKK